MTGSEFHTSYMCYGSGSTFAFVVATTALTAGVIPWWMLRGVLFWDNQLLVYILNFAWLPLVFYTIILQEAFKQPKLCVGADTHVVYGLPAYEALMTFAFISFVLSFCYMRGKSVCFKNSLMLASVVFITVWGLWFTGNYEFLHVAAGAVFGTLFGSGFAVWIYIYWIESFPPILELRVMKSYGFRDTLCTPSLATSDSVCYDSGGDDDDDHHHQHHQHHQHRHEQQTSTSGTLYHFLCLEGDKSGSGDSSDSSDSSASSVGTTLISIDEDRRRVPVTLPSARCPCPGAHTYTPYYLQ